MRRFLTALIFLLIAGVAGARAQSLRLAVTTSFENSGLADVLLPRIEKDLGLDVQLLVVGTGQALALGAAGDVDAVLVHARAAEEKFIASGQGLHRREIMYNDFVLVGPVDDPAKIAESTSAANGFRRIARKGAVFVSRGDDSGTNKKELALWEAAGVQPVPPKGAWYRAAGAGMGATLNIASGMDAYVLADRASWLKFGNKGGLKLLYAGDPALFNQYAYIPVNPRVHPNVKVQLALKLEEWLTGKTAAALINGYRVNGEKLFTFNAKPR